LSYFAIISNVENLGDFYIMDYLIWLDVLIIIHLIFTECFGGNYKSIKKWGKDVIKKGEGVLVLIVVLIIVLFIAMPDYKDAEFSTYLGFTGGIIGSIIGGIFTLVAVQRTINLTIEKEESDKIPTKIITLDEIIDEINDLNQKYTTMYNCLIETNQRIEDEVMTNGLTPHALLGHQVYTFKSLIPQYRKTLIEKSAKVNSQAYTKTRNFFNELESSFETEFNQNYRQLPKIPIELENHATQIKESKIKILISEITKIKKEYDQRFN
jgi:hypothetical protein